MGLRPRLAQLRRARATLPDGTLVAGAYSVRTGSCASRFEVRVPAPRGARQGRAGADRRRLGDRRLQAAPVHRPAARRQGLHGRRLQEGRHDPHAPLPGEAARAAGASSCASSEHKVKRTIAVGGGAAAKPPPVVLATGDSTMQGVDNFLADELGDDGTVRSDIRIGTGIGKSDWQAIAEGAGQALQAALHA